MTSMTPPPETVVVPWLKQHERRTHGVYKTQREANQAAYDLAYLMNGVPFGCELATVPKMGAFALISYRKYL